MILKRNLVQPYDHVIEVSCCIDSGCQRLLVHSGVIADSKDLKSKISGGPNSHVDEIFATEN